MPVGTSVVLNKQANIPKTVTAGQTAVATEGKVFGKPVSTTVGETATIQRQTGLVRTPTVVETTTLSRLPSHTLSGGQSSSATVSRKGSRIIRVSNAAITTVSPGKVFSFILTTTQQAGHDMYFLVLGAAQSVAATLGTIKVKIASLSTTQNQNATVIKQPQKIVSIIGSMMPLPPIITGLFTSANLFINKSTAISLTASQGQLSTISRSISHKLTSAVAQVAVVLKTPSKVLVAVQNQLANVDRLRGSIRTTNQDSVAQLVKLSQIEHDVSQPVVVVVEKRPRVSLAIATVGQAATVTRQKIAAVVSTIATQPTIVKLSRVISTGLTTDPEVTDAQITKLPQVTMRTVEATNAVVLKQPAHVLQATTTALTSLSRTKLALLRASQPSVAVFKRLVARILKTTTLVTKVTLIRDVLQLIGIPGVVALRMIDSVQTSIRHSRAVQAVMRHFIR